MPSAKRVDTPYTVCATDLEDAYFGLALSPQPSRGARTFRACSGTRPATPACPSPALDRERASMVSFGENSYFPSSPALKKTAMFSGLGLGGAPSRQHGGSEMSDNVEGEQTRTPSGNLANRRPSLQIVNMPACNLSAGTASADDSDEDSDDGSSEATLTRMPSFALESTVKNVGFSGIEGEEGEQEEGEESETPTVATFGLALTQGNRRATPYPTHKLAYFEEADTRDDDEEAEDFEANGSNLGRSLDGDFAA